MTSHKRKAGDLLLVHITYMKRIYKSTLNCAQISKEYFQDHTQVDIQMKQVQGAVMQLHHELQ
jgi:hypothetical protein